MGSKGPTAGLAVSSLMLGIRIERCAECVRLRAPQRPAHVNVHAEVVVGKLVRHRALDVEYVLEVGADPWSVGARERHAHRPLEAEAGRLEPVRANDGGVGEHLGGHASEDRRRAPAPTKLRKIRRNRRPERGALRTRHTQAGATPWKRAR